MGRLQVFVRWLFTPYEFVESFVPESGRIVDLGCGYGLFANFLSVKSGKRDVFGVDISAERIRRADKTVGLRRNIGFVVGDLKNFEFDDVDVFVIYDVLHHINRKGQVDLVERCFRVLNRGGLFVIKESGITPLWKGIINYLIEFFALGFRITESEGLNFRSQEDWEDLLRAKGFTVEVSEHIRSWHPWPHILFVCRRE